MNRIRRYLVVLLIGLFAAGTMAGAAMAHCDHARAGGHGPEMAMDGMQGTGDGSGHVHAGEVSAHDCHSDSAQPADNSSHDTQQSNCHNCDGSLCQSPTIAPEPAAVGQSASAVSTHHEEDIHIRTITLAVIPDPPKQLS